MLKVSEYLGTNDHYLTSFRNEETMVHNQQNDSIYFIG